MSDANPRILPAALAAAAILLVACGTTQKTVPRQERWGIYALDLADEGITLLHSAPREIQSLRLNNAGDAIVFCQKMDGDANEFYEINTVRLDGGNPRRLTSNALWDLYPAWSPDDSQIAFLSWRETDLDIYIMEADGSDPRRLYDSGGQDADIDWVGDRIVFTAGSRVWTVGADGTGARQLTDPPRAGEWGRANLPFGDYDPRLSPDGTRIVFERLEGDTSPHGNYNLFVVNADGTGETRLTANGYAQGLAGWSHAGDRIVFVVAAVNGAGRFDLYVMNADGTGSRDITPRFFPPAFLVHSAVFSKDDSKVYFIGEWWQE